MVLVYLPTKLGDFVIFWAFLLVCIFQHHGSHIDPRSPLSSLGIGTAADLSSSGLSAGRWYCRNGAPKKDGDL